MTNIKVTMLKLNAQNAQKLETEAIDAINAAVKAHEVYLRAAEDKREVPEGMLHCDDAVCKGCIMNDAPVGPSKMKVREIPLPILKMMISSIAPLALQEKSKGMHYGEWGHSASEWLEDLETAWKVLYENENILMNELAVAEAKVAEVREKLKECINTQGELIESLPDTLKEEIQEILKLQDFAAEHPELAGGVVIPTLPVDIYIPSAELEAAIDAMEAAYASDDDDCGCDCDCDCGCYYDDEDEDCDGPW